MALATIDSFLEQIDDLVQQCRRHRRHAVPPAPGRAGSEKAAGTPKMPSPITSPAPMSAFATRINLVRMAGYIRSDGFPVAAEKSHRHGRGQPAARRGHHQRRQVQRPPRPGHPGRRPWKKAASRNCGDHHPGHRPHQGATTLSWPCCRASCTASKNRDLFQITLKVFKKILSPADAKSFIAYLHHGDQLVAEGSFEILCFRGDEAVYFFVAEFFREHSRLLLRAADGQRARRQAGRADRRPASST